MGFPGSQSTRNKNVHIIILLATENKPKHDEIMSSSQIKLNSFGFVTQKGSFLNIPFVKGKPVVAKKRKF